MLFKLLFHCKPFAYLSMALSEFAKHKQSCLECSTYNVVLFIMLYQKRYLKNTINQTPLYLNKKRCHPEEPNTSTLLVNNFFFLLDIL